MQPGTCLGDRYVVNELVGTGDTGSIWFGIDTVVERPVRIKVLGPGLARDDAARARFRRTALAVASLDVPGIGEVYDCVEERDGDDITVCQIGERFDGEPLRHKLLTGRTFGAEDALGLVAALARSLHAAHQRGLVHLNLKSSNVLVSATGQTRIVDFGFQQNGDAADDVYALGSLAYECLAGAKPFLVEPDAPPGEQERQPQPLPSTVAPAVVRFVKRALSRRPDERFTTAARLAVECEQINYTHDVLGALLDRSRPERESEAASGLGSQLEAAMSPPATAPDPESQPAAAPDAESQPAAAPDAEPESDTPPSADVVAGATALAAAAPIAAAADSGQEPMPGTADTDPADEPDPVVGRVVAEPSEPVAAEPSAEPSGPAADEAAAEPTGPAADSAAESPAEPTTKLRSASVAAVGESVPPTDGEPDPEPDVRPRRKRRLTLVAVLALLLAIAGTAIAVTLFPGSTASSTGDGSDQGIAEPQDTSLITTGEPSSSGGDRAGNDPTKSDSASESSKSPTKSDADDGPDEPERVTVPNVVGDDARSAYYELRGAGLDVTVDRDGHGDHACPVHDQNPDSGTTVDKGSNVVMSVRMVRKPQHCDGGGGGGDDDD